MQHSYHRRENLHAPHLGGADRATPAGLFRSRGRHLEHVHSISFPLVSSPREELRIPLRPSFDRARRGAGLDAVLTDFRAGTALAPEHGATVDSTGLLACFHHSSLSELDGSKLPETP